MYYYYDPTYILIIIGAIIALGAQLLVDSSYRKWSEVYSSTGLRGEDVARRILDGNGLTDVPVTRIPGHLTDHFDPEQGILCLSDSVYSSSSVAALGVAAHEAGHAIQEKEGYFPMRLRSTLVPVANIGSRASIPLFFLGLFLSFQPLVKIGIYCFFFAVLFYVVTIPVELDASRRAVAILETGFLPESEMTGVRKMLTAAAMTYVASALQAVLQLLRLVLLSRSGKRRD